MDGGRHAFRSREVGEDEDAQRDSNNGSIMLSVRQRHVSVTGTGFGGVAHTGER